jgi:hypothetical protein
MMPGRFLGGCGRRVLSDLIDCAASASGGCYKMDIIIVDMACQAI